MAGKIDIHTHLLPKEFPNWSKKFGVEGFVSLKHTGPCKAQMLKSDGTLFREVDDRLWDPAARLKDCDHEQVDTQVLSTVPVMFSYWAKADHALEVSRFLNDDLANTVAKHPKRFQGLGTVPLQDPEKAIGELERCVKQLGLRGVQIGSSVNDWNLNEPALQPFFKAAESLGAAVFVHPWDMPAGARMKKYWFPWLIGMPMEVAASISSMIFGGVFEKHPALRVAFAHGGGAFAGTFGRIEHGFHARPDLCAVDNPHPPSKYLGTFFVDSLVIDQRSLQLIVDRFGEDKIILGSDYPFPLGEQKPGAAIEAMKTFSAPLKQKLLRENALKWLGLESL